MPRVVIGAPLYAHEPHLEAALESLLEQTYEDFALVLVDDRSPDGTEAVARRFAARDQRVSVHVNPERLGMLENTRRAFALAREQHPEAELWALASDHDVWEPTWLERLVAALDERPEAVLAYPLTDRIDEGGAVVSGSWRFSSVGIDDPGARLRHCLARMVSGDMIYGLFRMGPAAAVGGYRPVLAPDRLLLSELALHGEFVQVPELLWHRRYLGLASLRRQRRAFWPDRRPPLSSRAPWWAVHTASFARRHGWGLALRHYVPGSVRFQVRSRLVRLRNLVLGRPAKALLARPVIRHLVAGRVVPGLRAGRVLLERLVDEAERDHGSGLP